MEVRQVGRADPALQEAHWTPAFPVSPVRACLLPLGPPGSSHEEAYVKNPSLHRRQEEDKCPSLSVMCQKQATTPESAFVVKPNHPELRSVARYSIDFLVTELGQCTLKSTEGFWCLRLTTKKSASIFPK